MTKEKTEKDQSKRWICVRLCKYIHTHVDILYRSVILFVKNRNKSRGNKRHNEKNY